jgi:predicted DNA-binding transcriptional regulator YafY
MARQDRLQKMQRLFRVRRSISMADLKTELEVRGRATVKRYLDYLKDTVGIPVRYDRSLGGYRIDRDGVSSETGLLGLWFSASELHALLTMNQLLQKIEPGILGAQIEPLKERLSKILGTAAHSLAEIEKRVRILPMTARPVVAKIYQDCLTALLNRKRLNISYLARKSGESSVRTISPQRLVYYRDNWYLDAWCHSRRGLRMFSVDAIKSSTLSSEQARDMPEEYLKAVLESGYGIFSGRRTRIARLRFSPAQARWMSSESWHPKQKATWDRKGNYYLRFPYSNHPELAMDLLRHIPDIEVLGPKSLRNHLNSRIKAAAEKLP